MKKILTITVIVMTVLFVIAVPTMAKSGEIKVCLDGEKIEFDVKPQTINDRIMVPIRAIFEKMGAAVVWDDSTGMAVCTKDDTVVKMKVGSSEMYINDRMIKMDVEPVVINGRTLAPARYVAEAFGADVQWIEKDNTVAICSQGACAYAENSSVLAESEEKKVTLYAPDGRTTAVNEEEVSAYLKVGWYKTEAETKQTLYALDGRTISVYKAEVPAYLKVGWYKTEAETKQTLYALDGRTILVYKAEVPAYLKVGWYKTEAETKQALYALDGRTISVYKADVPEYLNVGWYESREKAQKVNTTSSNQSSSSNAVADGSYYRTPTGKRYHLDPDCGGANSYRTTNISGLTPCSKCAK